MTSPTIDPDSSPLHPTAAHGFEAGARVYDAARPGYPPEALDLLDAHLGLRTGARVLELGAGTGKLTRELVGRGAEVVAVEPVAGMRDQLTRLLPDVEVLAGRAEDVPLDDGSVDAVAVAHAFHWFDGPVALAEIHRVLRPDGRLAILFNRRDLATPVQAALDHLLLPFRGDTPSWATNDWADVLEDTDLFASIAFESYPNPQHLDATGLAARVASVSFVANLDDRARGRVLTAVHDLFERSQRDGVVDLHHVTEVRLLRRVG